MIRFDDLERTVTLSVRDLVEAGAPTGHLTLEVVQRRAARARAGQRIHTAWQATQRAKDVGYEAEVVVRMQVAVGDWTVRIHGRIDGLTEDEGIPVVEEVKSTALDGPRLLYTRLEDWPRHTAQLEIYVWMLQRQRGRSAAGRLVLISVADGARHVLGLVLDAARVQAQVHARLEEIVAERERRLAWLAARREATVHRPHPTWRAGQREITEAVEWGLDAGHQVLVEAPTGMGKTAAVLDGVMRYALAHDKQVFWATARTTQQGPVERTVAHMRQAGTPLTSVVLTARDKICLNDVVACRPDACRFADRYHDKVREARLLDPGRLPEHADADALQEVGRRWVVCPFQLGLDLSTHVDVVIGDTNYALSPSVHIRRHFADNPEDWVLVVDEAHQLVERARGWGSPRIEAALADVAATTLAQSDPDRYAAFVGLAHDIADRVRGEVAGAEGRGRGGERVADHLDADTFADLAERLDDVAVEYAVLKAEHPAVPIGERDPWLDLARQVLGWQLAAEVAGDETVGIVRVREGDEQVGLLCLDPSPTLGPRLARLGGLVGLSATLSPTDFYVDLLGLEPPRLDFVRVPNPFPAERLRVLVAPRVSTAWRDRRDHADATARLLAACIGATPGNVACYFPSFEMLHDISGRWKLEGTDVLIQRPSMDDATRRAWLERLAAGGPPVVLGAVLGGIFAEGIDLPSGALKLVAVAGPALPPVGLERDLLREYYESRYGQGFRYASLVPGLTRVIQAAGRLIRRPEDCGVVVLVGRRFRWREVRDQLPAGWEPQIAADPGRDVAAFWADMA